MSGDHVILFVVLSSSARPTGCKFHVLGTTSLSIWRPLLGEHDCPYLRRDGDKKTALSVSRSIMHPLRRYQSSADIMEEEEGLGSGGHGIAYMMGRAEASVLVYG